MKPVFPARPLTGHVAARFLALLFLPVSVQAGYDFHQQLVSFPTLTVNSSGSEYTGLDGIGYVWEGKFRITAYGATGINHWEVWPSVYIDDTGQGDMFKIFSATDSYQSTEIPKKEVNEIVGTIFPNTPAISTWAVGLCEEMAEALRADGLTDGQIFAVDRSIPVQVALDHEVSHSGPAGLQQADTPPSEPASQVICRANTAPVDDITINENVQNAHLTIVEQATQGGACQVTLSSVIETYSASMEINFRYVDDQGNESDVKSVTTDHTRKVFSSHTYGIPANPDGGENGSIHIEILSGSPMTSNIAQYDMDCAEGVTGDYASALPPELSLSVAPIDNIMVGDWVCPSKLVMAATIDSYSEIEAEMMFVGNSYFSAPQSVSQGYGDTRNYFGYRDLSWEADLGDRTSGQSDEDIPESQNVTLWFSIFDGDNQIAALPWQNYQVACAEPTSRFGGLADDIVSKPGQTGDGTPVFGAAIKSRQSAASQLVLTPGMDVDIGVTDLALELRDRRGEAGGYLENRGQAGVQARYTLVVKKAGGRRVAWSSDKIDLEPGERRPVSVPFDAEAGTRYDAILQANVFGDRDPTNNRLLTSITSEAAAPLLPGPPKKKTAPDETQAVTETDERKPGKSGKPGNTGGGIGGFAVNGGGGFKAQDGEKRN